jgi:1,2-phenylacetyl-CoA epoxidase catalytic subunit
LATYISDMLALEEHVRVPFEAQLRDADLAKYTPADALVRRLSDLCNTHIQSLQAALQAMGGHEAHAAKSTVANIEGWFASAIDMIRKTKIAKALRDDYTALSLCCVAYSMLLATANALASQDVAQLAQRHLRDYAQILMELGVTIPDVVVQDLREAGATVAQASAGQTRMQIETAWRISAAVAHGHTETGTIESEAAINRSASPTYPTI